MRRLALIGNVLGHERAIVSSSLPRLCLEFPRRS